MRSRGAVLLTAAVVLLAGATCATAASVDAAKLDELNRALEPKVIAWRRDFHEHPELSNREVRTAKAVADHLKKLGLEVETGIAHTGVAAFLKGGLPGPTIALRADNHWAATCSTRSVRLRPSALGRRVGGAGISRLVWTSYLAMVVS